MLIHLDDFRQAKNSVARENWSAAGLKNGTYGGGVVTNARGSARLYALHIPAQSTLSPELPQDFSKIDVESFINRIYALATQV